MLLQVYRDNIFSQEILPNCDNANQGNVTGVA